MNQEQARRQKFEDCVQQCADSLYRVAYRLTGTQSSASDLVQETYVNAWKGLDSLKDDSRMRSWMFAILRNQYSKFVRKESRMVNADNMQQTVVDTGPDQHKEAVHDAVQMAINQLDETHKLPLLLVSIEGMSTEQAAIILEIPKGTVLSRLHRARQKMKSYLQRETSLFS